MPELFSILQNSPTSTISEEKFRKLKAFLFAVKASLLNMLDSREIVFEKPNILFKILCFMH